MLGDIDLFPLRYEPRSHYEYPELNEIHSMNPPCVCAVSILRQTTLCPTANCMLTH